MEEKNVYDKTTHEIDIRELIALICAEIDDIIFSSVKKLTKEEMRLELQKIVIKWCSNFEDEVNPIIDNVPFYKACKIYQAYSFGLTDKEIKGVVKEILSK